MFPLSEQSSAWAYYVWNLTSENGRGERLCERLALLRVQDLPDAPDNSVNFRFGRLKATKSISVQILTRRPRLCRYDCIEMRARQVAVEPAQLVHERSGHQGH